MHHNYSWKSYSAANEERPDHALQPTVCIAFIPIDASRGRRSRAWVVRPLLHPVIRTSRSSADDRDFRAMTRGEWKSCEK